VRKLHEFNLALFGKWCWRMLVAKEGLWHRVLKTSYGEEGGSLKEIGRDCSLWWRMLSRIRGGVGLGEGSWFYNNVRRVVGGVGTTFFWTNNWVGGVPLRERFPRLFDLAVDRWVSVEDMVRQGWEDGGSSCVWRRRLFAWEEECVRECYVLLHDIVLQEHLSDR